PGRAGHAYAWVTSLGWVVFSGRTRCDSLHRRQEMYRPGRLSRPGEPRAGETPVASIPYSQVRRGMVIKMDDGKLYTVVDRDLNTPGNWRAILQLKLKNLETGAVTNSRVRPEDKVEQAYLENRNMQYLYQEGDGYVFMDNETFDQITLGRDWVGDQMGYLKENMNAQVVFYEGKPISLELPASVE